MRPTCQPPWGRWRANATLTDIRLDGYGGYPTGAPFLAAASVTTGAGGTPGLAGWTVYLDANHNGRFDSGEPSTVTDANGNFTFTGLAPGTYTVAEVPQVNWLQTAPTTRTFTVTVDSGQTIGDLDFGNQPQPGANELPAFTSTPPASATVGQIFSYQATASDADGDSLRFDLIAAPAGLADRAGDLGADAKSGRDAVRWYPSGQPTLRALVACSPKGGRYHAETGAARSREREVLAATASPVATEWPDRSRLLCGSGA